MNRQLQKQLLDYDVPSVMSYVQKKMSVTDLEKSIKTWQRKVAVAEVRPGWVCGGPNLCQLGAGSWWSLVCATLGTVVFAPDLLGSRARVLPWHRGSGGSRMCLHLALCRMSVCTAVWGEKWLVWMGQIVCSCTLTPCSSSSRDGLSCGWDGESSELVTVQHLAPQHASLQ